MIFLINFQFLLGKIAFLKASYGKANSV